MQPDGDGAAEGEAPSAFTCVATLAGKRRLRAAWAAWAAQVAAAPPLAGADTRCSRQGTRTVCGRSVGRHRETSWQAAAAIALFAS